MLHFIAISALYIRYIGSYLPKWKQNKNEIKGSFYIKHNLHFSTNPNHNV